MRIKHLAILLIPASLCLSPIQKTDYLSYLRHIYSGSGCKDYLVIKTIDITSSQDIGTKIYGFKFENCKAPEVFANGKKMELSDTLLICETTRLQVRFEQTEEAAASFHFESGLEYFRNNTITFDRDALYLNPDLLRTEKLLLVNNSYTCLDTFKVYNFNSLYNSQLFVYKNYKLIRTLPYPEYATFSKEDRGLYQLIYRNRLEKIEFAIIFQ